MKTTLNIADVVMTRLKERAARERKTVSYLVESALRLYLERAEQPVELPPLPRFNGGGYLVDIADRNALYEVLDAEKNERLYGHVRSGHKHPRVRRR